MPSFQWSGRDKNGKVCAGTIAASSEEQALARLRSQEIKLTSIHQIGSSDAGLIPSAYPKAVAASGTGRAILTRIVMGLALLAGAFFILSISTGSTIRCTAIVPGNPYECTVQTSMAGLYLLSEERISGATGAAVEQETEDSYSPETGHRTGKKTRVVITGNTGMLATPWMAYPFQSSESVVAKLNEQFDHRGTPSFQLRQVESAPAGAGALMTVVALWMLMSGVRKGIRRIQSGH